MPSHNTRTAENSSDIMSISSKSPVYTSDAEVVPDDDSESETPPSSPSFSDHNSDHFDEMNDIEDIQVSLSITHSVPESQHSNADVPDDAQRPILPYDDRPQLQQQYNRRRDIATRACISCADACRSRVSHDQYSP
jgi:hypothetical protein